MKRSTAKTAQARRLKAVPATARSKPTSGQMPMARRVDYREWNQAPRANRFVKDVEMPGGKMERQYFVL